MVYKRKKIPIAVDLTTSLREFVSELCYTGWGQRKTRMIALPDGVKSSTIDTIGDVLI